LKTGQPVLNREELLVNVHGQQRWLLTSKLALRNADGRISGILGIGHNITERKQLEQTLAIERESLEQRVNDRTRELATANDRLQDLDRLKNKFVSDVSHELRTPVTSLLLYLDLLEHGKPEKRAHYLASSIEQARRMQQLIENILDLSRLERDTAQPVFEPVDLNAVLERVVLTQQPRAEAAGLRLVLDATPDLPQVQGDVNHLLQVMTNLIANAISYTPVGAVHVRSSVQSNYVSVEVRDTGLGVAPEDLPHLFERFYRGEVGRRASAPGTGLGLAISKEIMERLGGRITVESEAGQGAAFTVWLRMAAN
jgi:signal transduction histidine kinase